MFLVLMVELRSIMLEWQYFFTAQQTSTEIRSMFDVPSNKAPRHWSRGTALESADYRLDYVKLIRKVTYYINFRTKLASMLFKKKVFL